MKGFILLALLSGVLSGLLPSLSNPVFASEGESKGEAKQIPIMLYFSRTDCHYCRNFEEDILKPLINSGTYSAKIIIREVELDSSQPARTFGHKLKTPEELAQMLDVQVTPTLLFVDNNGAELVSRIVGYQKTGYYSYHLEEAINQAGEALRNH
ncbi:MAG: hypothetical protein DRR06_07430 [Gammaproteobacteria bacterium]|nr:MAG: hypothetical protein DRR06_07430 [Gammaproteobacteria bacterium]RLA51755.1 MAG: hypothetical protein DRR42_09455 [Gammaproteobacteria bacterium]